MIKLQQNQDINNGKLIKKMIISLIGYGYYKGDIIAFVNINKEKITAIIDEIQG